MLHTLIIVIIVLIINQLVSTYILITFDAIFSKIFCLIEVWITFPWSIMKNHDIEFKNLLYTAGICICYIFTHWRDSDISEGVWTLFWQELKRRIYVIIVKIMEHLCECKKSRVLNRLWKFFEGNGQRWRKTSKCTVSIWYHNYPSLEPTFEI